ncbi:MAG: dicarboxylate/amino acid:cation symporter [Planctomycetaceae bacterium]|nr:dicarboxylate/amino acid:cation symporter [Planctomycetales bacterium]MCB9873013.1 dicarboxylate/amino acid:cation symporter [Planctomycetaceae bacterium]MCB9937006.1 dicarboxylate/amino acid:cation symporter [Planctomycetaceae bacterium]
MSRLALHWQILGGMLLGAAVGLTMNFTASERNVDVSASELPKGITAAKLHDSANLITIDLTQEDGTERRWVVDGTRATPGSLATLDKLHTRDAQSYDIFQQHGRSWSRWVGDAAQRLGGLFLRMLKMVAVPLIATSLITGVMGLGHAERLGKMFGRTLLYYMITSLLAIVTGLAMVNIIRPGLGGEKNEQALEAEIASGNLGDVLFEQVETMIPANPIGALAEGNFLSIICFSLAFAIFALIVGGKTAEIVRDFFGAAFEVMMAMTMAIIKLAPFGVLFLMMSVTATQGAEVFKSLGWYMLTVACALAFHAMITLPMIVKFVARRDPMEFAKAMSPALLTAFSSASSNGTLPLTLASVEDRAGVSNRVSSFVLPLGATINMDGTALYEAVAVLFIAQLYHGHNLPITEQILVAFTALLASVGAAGIPHAGLVMMVIILQAVKLPVEMQGIIIAVDRVLDMCRTSVNVWSDSCGCAVIAHYEALGRNDAEDIPDAADNLE